MPNKNNPIPITSDGGVVKLLLSDGDPCKLPPSWIKGSKASFHFTAYTIPYHQKQEAGNWFKSGLALAKLNQEQSEEEAERENFHTATCSHDDKRVDPNKRTKIGDSKKWDGFPFDLRINMGFSVQVLELAVKTMRIGEKARFYCNPSYAEVTRINIKF
jgi:hypothetical protein